MFDCPIYSCNPVAILTKILLNSSRQALLSTRAVSYTRYSHWIHQLMLEGVPHAGSEIRFNTDHFDWIFVCQPKDIL